MTGGLPTSIYVQHDSNTRHKGERYRMDNYDVIVIVQPRRVCVRHSLRPTRYENAIVDKQWTGRGVLECGCIPSRRCARI